jgi:hypothetical protein
MISKISVGTILLILTVSVGCQREKNVIVDDSASKAPSVDPFDRQDRKELPSDRGNLGNAGRDEPRDDRGDDRGAGIGDDAPNGRDGLGQGPGTGTGAGQGADSTPGGLGTSGPGASGPGASGPGASGPGASGPGSSQGNGGQGGGATPPDDERLIGNWNGEEDLNPSQWTIVDHPLNSGGATTGGGGATTGATPPPSNGQTNAVAFDGANGIGALVAANCATSGCHTQAGPRPPLTTYEQVRTAAQASLNSINAGRMPRGSTMSPEARQRFAAWVAAGTPRNATAAATGGGAAQDSGAAQDGGGQFATEFRIRAGTGRNSWNTQATTVVVRVGTTLTIINEDSVPHRLHTNGAPCAHGNDIPPGGRGVCRITAPYNGPPLYNHNVGPSAAFHIRAVN